MPIYDNDGATSYPTARIYDNDGAASVPIGKIYDNDGAEKFLIYNSEENHTLELSRVQDGTWGYVEQQNTQGFYAVRFTRFSPGTSYGETLTKVELLRNGTVVQTLADVYAVWNGSAHSMGGTDLPLETEIEIQPEDCIRLSMRANYDANISGQHTSQASVSFTFY